MSKQSIHFYTIFFWGGGGGGHAISETTNLEKNPEPWGSGFKKLPLEKLLFLAVK
jgi:hypothetical protein